LKLEPQQRLFVREQELLKRLEEGGAHGLTWHYSRPPIESIEYEMDLRGCITERVI
jgi:hypothetical protein